MTGRHIICGFGHVGYRIAGLLGRLGIPCAIIHGDAPAEWIREAEASGTLCFQGDARDTALLERAGLRSAAVVYAVTDRDLVNLAIAVDAGRLNPNVTVVLRLFDQELARQIEGALRVRQVLSTSALAAPLFATAACGQDEIGRFSVAGTAFVLQGRTSRTDGKSRTSQGDTAADEAVLLLTLPPGGGPANSPDSVGAGIRLMARPATAACRRPRSPWRGFAAILGQLAGSISGTTRGVLLILVAIVVVGVVVARQTMGLSTVDALYFVTSTITTVGYGDITFSQASAAVKLFGCFLMLSGAALLATLFSLVTEALLSRRLAGLLATRPLPHHDHIIVVGTDHVAQRTLQALAGEGVETVWIAAHADFARRVEALPLLVGDAREERVLRRAGVQRAQAVVAVQDDDVVNLGVALLAKRLNPKVRTVIRLFDSTLAAKLQGPLSLDAVMSVSGLAAPSFVAAALGEHVRLATTWQDHLLVVQVAPAEARLPLLAARATFSSFTLEHRAGRPTLRRVESETAAVASGERVRVSLLPLASRSEPPASL